VSEPSQVGPVLNDRNMILPLFRMFAYALFDRKRMFALFTPSV
jgi:hypothetical protein